MTTNDGNECQRPDASGEEILSALIDGEPIAPASLLRAMESPDALELLRGFASLRVAIASVDIALRSEFERDVLPLVRSTDGADTLWRRTILVPFPLIAVSMAGAIGVALMAFWIANRPAEFRMQERPPEPARVIPFEQGVDWYGVGSESSRNDGANGSGREVSHAG